MYVRVKLLDGFKQPLLYRIPEQLEANVKSGTLVRVSVRNRLTYAMVDELLAQKPAEATYTIKALEAIERFPADPCYIPFLQKLGLYYCQEPVEFIKRIHSFLDQKEHEEPINSSAIFNSEHQINIKLTQEQEQVFNYVSEAITTQKYSPTLLHGVTGSGKTEIYKKLIEHAQLYNKSILLVLPEVTLAVQFTTLLRKQLSNQIPILSFHSATSMPEKRTLWQSLLNGTPIVIIGVHLPVMLPISNLGLIIIDEEHEVGYQEKKHPKINTKEAALLRAQSYQIPILLGSATPAVSTLYTVKKQQWKFFQLKKRFGGSFPTVEIVSLLENKNRKNFWITKQLHEAVADRLSKNEQVIIFLNRRGYSFFVQCKSCSFIFSCSSCSVSLTLHGEKNLICHYCGFKTYVPTNCPSCQGAEDKFLKKGIGTQQVVTILQKLFPQARIDRADLDVTVNKKNWQKTLQEFEAGAIDILVGTQTITKGYHFPRVTLVGILWADLNLHFPLYNAAETTLQQLIQVAGRAGRQSDHSLVIVQTMLDHSIFKFLNEIDYLKFYAYELEKRTEVNYPPCIRLCELELKHEDEATVDKEAEQLAKWLTYQTEQTKKTVQILGPATPTVGKIKNIHIRSIFLKAAYMNNILDIYKSIDKEAYKSAIFFTPNPLT